MTEAFRQIRQKIQEGTLQVYNERDWAGTEKQSDSEEEHEESKEEHDDEGNDESESKVNKEDGRTTITISDDDTYSDDEDKKSKIDVNTDDINRTANPAPITPPPAPTATTTMDFRANEPNWEEGREQRRLELKERVYNSRRRRGKP